jgi:hypothetical protein
MTFALAFVVLTKPSMPMIAQFAQPPLFTAVGVSTNSVIGESCPGGGAVLLLKICSGNSDVVVPIPKSVPADWKMFEFPTLWYPAS